MKTFLLTVHMLLGLFIQQTVVGAQSLQSLVDSLQQQSNEQCRIDFVTGYINLQSEEDEIFPEVVEKTHCLEPEELDAFFVSELATGDEGKREKIRFILKGMVLSGKFNVGTRGRSGNMITIFSAEEGKVPVQLPLSLEVLALAENKYETTALIASVKQPNLAKALITAGADLNAKTIYGGTALYWASMNGEVEVIKALIEAGADLNPRNHEGVTPLNGASSAGQIESVRVLLEAGADLHSRDQFGDTSLYWAEVNKHMEVAALLRSYGATR